MSEHTLMDRMRVASLLPWIDDSHINLPLEERIYNRELADFLLDTEEQTGALALAERERDGISTVVFKEIT